MPVMPSDSPSAPSEYAAVPVSGLDIQAPQADLSGAVMAAQDAAMARQPEAREVLESAQGYGDFDIMAGYTGSWGVVAEPEHQGP